MFCTSPPVGQGAVLQELEARLKMSPDHTIYMGDGSSDLYVMQHVNSRDGHTIAVSESKSIGRIAHRTVLSDNALSVLVPILEDILKWDSSQIRELFASYGSPCRTGTRFAPTGLPSTIPADAPERDAPRQLMAAPTLDPAPSPGVRASRLAVSALFCVSGVLFANWVARIPAVQAERG